LNAQCAALPADPKDHLSATVRPRRIQPPVAVGDRVNSALRADQDGPVRESVAGRLGGFGNSGIRSALSTNRPMEDLSAGKTGAFGENTRSETRDRILNPGFYSTA
jgi:hypothetical protein